jgi:hypothetical protein
VQLPKHRHGEHDPNQGVALGVLDRPGSVGRGVTVEDVRDRVPVALPELLNAVLMGAMAVRYRIWPIDRGFPNLSGAKDSAIMRSRLRSFGSMSASVTPDIIPGARRGALTHFGRTPMCYSLTHRQGHHLRATPLMLNARRHHLPDHQGGTTGVLTSTARRYVP